MENLEPSCFSAFVIGAYTRVEKVLAAVSTSTNRVRFDVFS
ncbi:hypothetical protein [Myxococcus xanthus]|nr:hypothetical protein [Myxococcus xanthus]